ncbi:MAG TPA: Rnase Y domain-containing protein, partial [Clostridia bacterium]
MFKKGIEHRKQKAEAEIGSAEQEAKRIISESQRQGEGKKREILLEAKEEVHRSRVELEREIKDRRNEIQRLERRLLQKEETLDKKVEALEQKEEVLNKKTKEIQTLSDKTLEIQKRQMEELERISGLSIDEAKEYLLRNVENEVKHEAAILIKDIEARAKEEADRKAKDIIANAIQKCAADHVSETTVSVVPLP